MLEKFSKSVDKKPRADAARNRERILQVAKEAFNRSGASVSLDEIAKSAEIGPGTLYRHFPNRDALLEAVYRSEVERLAAAEVQFSMNLAPVEALEAWMLLFVDYIAAKQIIVAAIDINVMESSSVFAASSEPIIGAIQGLVGRAIESGEIRADLDPMDLLRALVGVSNVSSAPDWQSSAKRLVQILIKGSRPS